jgi:hypothetical protein
MKKYIVEVIPKNFLYHPFDTNVHLIYVKNLDSNTETLLKENELSKDLFKGSEIFTFNKKSLLQLCPFFKLFPVNDVHFIEQNKFTENYFEFPIYKFHYEQSYKYDKNINEYISSLKHLEYIQKKISLYENIVLNLDKSLLETDYFKFYNNHLTNIFIDFEKNNINYDNKLIKSNYNLYNQYSRPTNKSNGLNLSALSKENNIRERFQPINDLYIEFDYKNYQLKILYDLLGIEYENNIYENLGKLYKIEDRTKAKEKTLYYCFSEIYDNPYPKNKFFIKLFKIKNLLKNSDTFVSPISGKEILLKQNSGDLARILQIIETEQNVEIIKNINKLCETKKTKLMLYSYDAFLIDFSHNDGENFLDKIQKIIEVNGFVTKKVGTNYKNLK